MSRDGSLDAKSCGMVAFSNGRPSLPVLATERCHKRFVKFSIKPSLFSFFPAANLGIGFSSFARLARLNEEITDIFVDFINLESFVGYIIEF